MILKYAYELHPTETELPGMLSLSDVLLLVLCSDIAGKDHDCFGSRGFLCPGMHRGGAHPLWVSSSPACPFSVLRLLRQIWPFIGVLHNDFALHRVWVVLRMKEHMVANMLKERLQVSSDIQGVPNLQQAAFEQVCNSACLHSTTDAACHGMRRGMKPHIQEVSTSSMHISESNQSKSHLGAAFA